jgi:hypothetical protein
MPEEHLNAALEQLTETTAEQIIFALQPGAIQGDPKPVVMQLLRRYLEEAQEQEYQDILHRHNLEEYDQQN